MTLRLEGDLGGTNLRAALLDDKGSILKEAKEKTEVHVEPLKVIANPFTH
jgi:glucokinase